MFSTSDFFRYWFFCFWIYIPYISFCFLWHEFMDSHRNGSGRKQIGLKNWEVGIWYFTGSPKLHSLTDKKNTRFCHQKFKLTKRTKEKTSNTIKVEVQLKKKFKNSTLMNWTLKSFQSLSKKKTGKYKTWKPINILDWGHRKNENGLLLFQN